MNRLILVAILQILALFPLRGADLPESARIDSLLAENARPNPRTSDETILRRLYLDIIGRIPTLAEARTFLDSKEPLKRAKLIDTLLASDGYASHMFNFWADLLRVADSAKGPFTVADKGKPVLELFA